MSLLLAAAFFITALLYAAAGFGGGSTYAALLALSGLDFAVVPVLALICNIIVVAGSSIRFSRAGLIPWRAAGLLTLIAAPMAFLGGLTQITEDGFFLLLGASLLLTSVFLFLPQRGEPDGGPGRAARFIPVLAAPLGYLAGIVGIGGGVFLAPLLYLTRWNGARQIAATTAFFILVNSAFGLAGQVAKNSGDVLNQAATVGLPLMIAVIIGGQIGSILTVRFLPRKVLRWLTAILTSAVGMRLLLGM